MSWIAIDLDGTLAQYAGWMGCDSIGSPVPAMVDRIKHYQDKGLEIRIFTARAGVYEHYTYAMDQGWFNGHNHDHYADIILDLYMQTIKPIEDWCETHFGQRFTVTAMKDMEMLELWDDRAIRVEMNTGQIVVGVPVYLD
jgi:histidinol phosphatase-like enzyme